ncbi:hypothetical protein [Klenkia terrae]|uniref:Uncharacterized protein n=1 Tax=Klenkia terrae TaxID=1052259 RepID=A0ABU8E637_9ACTN|nr:hypothetical protein [Klenkia terrae]
MTVPFSIETQPDASLLVTLQDDEDPVQSWIQVTDQVCAQLGATEASRHALVERTVRFLLLHQAPADFPSLVDLEDVLAAYPESAAILGDAAAEGPIG